MTILLAKASREYLNIDTLERSITACLLLLRNACISEGQTYKYYNAVRISTNIRASGETYNANLVANLKMPYNSPSALISGMNLLLNLKELTVNNPIPSFLPITATVNPPQLPIEPNTVNTLEKYLLWASQTLAAFLLPQTERVKISFLEEDPKEPSVVIDLSLPLDWKIYLLTGNLIEATKLLVTNYHSQQPNDSNFGNQGTVGNLSLVGN